MDGQCRHGVEKKIINYLLLDLYDLLHSTGIFRKSLVVVLSFRLISKEEGKHWRKTAPESHLPLLAFRIDINPTEIRI